MAGKWNFRYCQPGKHRLSRIIAGLIRGDEIAGNTDAAGQARPHLGPTRFG